MDPGSLSSGRGPLSASCQSQSTRIEASFETPPINTTTHPTPDPNGSLAPWNETPTRQRDHHVLDSERAGQAVGGRDHLGPQRPPQLGHAARGPPGRHPGPPELRQGLPGLGLVRRPPEPDREPGQGRRRRRHRQGRPGDAADALQPQPGQPRGLGRDRPVARRRVHPAPGEHHPLARLPRDLGLLLPALLAAAADRHPRGPDRTNRRVHLYRPPRHLATRRHPRRPERGRAKRSPHVAHIPHALVDGHSKTRRL